MQCDGTIDLHENFTHSEIVVEVEGDTAVADVSIQSRGRRVCRSRNRNNFKHLGQNRSVGDFTVCVHVAACAHRVLAGFAWGPRRTIACEGTGRWDIRTLPALLTGIGSAHIRVDGAISSCEVFCAMANVIVWQILACRVVFARFRLAHFVVDLAISSVEAIRACAGVSIGGILTGPMVLAWMGTTQVDINATILATVVLWALAGVLVGTIGAVSAM